jgi:hypothetical protein
MPDEIKNPAAVELGKLGGQKTAERGSEYYAAINAKRKERKGGRPKNPPVVTHAGTLKIAGRDIGCAVLANGTRVLTQETFLSALGRSPKGKGGQIVSSPDGLPPFLAAENLRPFISEELRLATVPYIYRSQGGRDAYGYDAMLLPMVCEVYLNAKDAGKTTRQQEHIVRACALLTRGLAQTGIIALVDEATGYQYVRDREALQAILDAYLRKELAAWAKRFPDEFYEQMFRLRGWGWKGMKVNRPQVVGHYTNDLVWERLAPGIREELENKNPKNERGQRLSKHHQWLTEDIGHPALAQHLYGLIGFMRASDSWKEFYRLVQKAFPKKGETLLLPLPEPGK